MPGIFDGFPLSIFDDAIFDTKLVIPTPIPIREETSVGVPATEFTVQVVDV